MNKKQHEPLFHITKRAPMSWRKALLVRILAILAALVICAILTMAVSGYNPIKVYGAMFQGAFGSSRKIWITLQKTAILLIIALALTPAFKMKFWNIGGEGQVLMGALGAAACMETLSGKVPNAVCIILMVAVSLVAGAIWGLIPALLKAKWNTNETLATLMMNYIATQLVAYFVVVWESPKGSGKIGVINQNTQFGWLPEIGNRYLLCVILAVAAAIGMHIYLWYSKQGYEISVVGESVNTARYVGIKVEKVIIRTMLISGALCGLAGLLLAGGINHSLSIDAAGGQGFTAVLVSWLAKFNPFTMILASLLIIFMSRGSAQIASDIGLNESYSDIMTGIILFCLIGCEFFITYRISFRKKAGKEA